MCHASCRRAALLRAPIPPAGLPVALESPEVHESAAETVFGEVFRCRPPVWPAGAGADPVDQMRRVARDITPTDNPNLYTSKLVRGGQADRVPACLRTARWLQ